jgi:hypothetical protein
MVGMRKSYSFGVALQTCFAQQTRAFHFRHRSHAPITPRSENFSQWYLDVISSAELAESSPVKVCDVWHDCFSFDLLRRAAIF